MAVTRQAGSTDWEVHADTEAHLITVLKSISPKLFRNAVTSPSGRQIAAGIATQLKLANGTTIIINYYKTKMVQSGTQIIFGKTVPSYVAAPGVYGIMRWLSPTNASPPQPAAGSGVTLIPLPDDSPYRFA